MARRRDTTVHGLSVLSNLDLLERAGLATLPFLAALGETRESLLAGARIEWDRFAVEMERGVETVGLARMCAIAREMGELAVEVNPAIAHLTSQRACLSVLVDSMAPSLWPMMDLTLEDRGRGFAVIEIVIPAPRYVPRGYLELSTGGVETFPVHAGLPPVRVLDLELSADGRHASYFVELPDEHVREPLGSLGDTMGGAAVIPTLDIAELAGVDARPWLERHGLDRTTLMRDAAVRWDAYCEISELITRSAGMEAYNGATRQLALLTRDVGALAPAVDLVELYRFLHVDAVGSFWGPVSGAVISIRAGVIGVRLQVRAGLSGCRSVLLSHVGTLEGLSVHHGLAAARVRALHVDADDAGATFVVELPLESAGARGAAPRRTPPSTGSADLTVIDRIAVEAVRTRHAARAGIVERLGRTLASTTDVQQLADVVLETVVGALELDAMQIALSTGSSGELVPLRARGDVSGTALVRPLEHGGAQIGELRVWTRIERTGETLAALDLLTPWIAVALGTALTIARERRASDEASAARDGLQRTLEDVLSLHPTPAYLLSSDGRVVAANEPARRALGADACATLDRIARAVGENRRDTFDILPVRIASRVDRIVVLERASARSFEERMAAAMEGWSLTARQREVLDGVARGMSNKELAAALGCAEVTIENHLTSIFRKAGVDRRNRLVAKLTSL